MKRGFWVLLSLSLALLPGCGSGTAGHGSRDYCAASDGPYSGARALYAAYCDALTRCELGRALGYGFQCRQECVQSFDFTNSCGVVESDNENDRWNYRLEEREVIYDEEQGAACIAWWQTADCAVVRKLLDNERSSEEEVLR